MSESIFQDSVRAIRENDVKILQDFLDEGMDINIVDILHRSLLWYACRLDKPKIIQWLIDQKIDVNIQSGRGETALMMASQISAELTQLLLDANADLRFKDRTGRDAAVYSALSKKEGAFRLLVHAGADMNALFLSDDEKYYALFRQTFVSESIEEHIDQLTPKNLMRWKALRLRNLFT